MRISNCWHRSDGHLLGYNQTISTIPQVFCQLVPAEDKKQAGFGGQTKPVFHKKAVECARDTRVLRIAQERVGGLNLLGKL